LSLDRDIVIGQYQGKVDLLVAKVTTELILGVDFLVDRECQWDFRHSRIEIAGHCVKLHSRPQVSQVRRLYADEDIVIAAGHGSNVSVRAPLQTLHQTTPDWVVEPKLYGSGAIAASVVFAGRQFDVVRPVWNLSSEDYKIRKGDDMGIAVLANEQGRGRGFEPSAGRSQDRAEGFEPSVGSRSCARPVQSHYKICEPSAERQCNTRPECSEYFSSIPINEIPTHIQPVFNSLPEKLTYQDRKTAERLVMENADVFSAGEFKTVGYHIASSNGSTPA